MTLLFAAALLLQDKDAEETLKKIESTLEQAKTCFCLFKGDGILQLENLRVSGSTRGALRGKQPDKCLLEGRGHGVADLHYSWFSDGTLATCQTPGSDEKAVDKPERVRSRLAVAFVRAGATLSFLTLRVGPKEDDVAQIQALEVTDFVREPGDAAVQAISYTLVLPNPERKASVTLWYDPKSMLPTKRMIEYSAKGEEIKWSEVYENWSLNADIPDEKFKLPGQKK